MAIQRLPIPSHPDTRRGRAAGAPVDLAAVRALLRGLDREQRRAVTHADGPLQVIAGPGTGKTEVVTRRIAWLIATRRARPSEILGLTFTQRAADEMQARVDLLVPYGRADTAVHTFHAFGDSLIREFAHELGLPFDPRVIARSDAVLLLRDHLFELGLERYRPLADPGRFLGALAELFGRAKDEGVTPEDFEAAAAELAAGATAVLATASDEGQREVARALVDEAAGQRELAAAYARYQSLLRERGLLDFGDQVGLAVRLVRERPAVAHELSRRYRHVLVDEAQDANPSQLELVRAIASHGDLTVVGDDDQAIYAFRGAAAGSIRALGVGPHPVRRIVLRRNHRSRAPILAAAHSLIRQGRAPDVAAEAGLIAVRRGRRPAPVVDRAYATVTEEADAVAREIAQRVAAGASPGDFANTLTRTNGAAEPFLRSLSALDVAWHTATAVGLAGHPEVRDLLAFLAAVVEPSASTTLYQVATGEPYRLGGADLTTILESSRRRHWPLWEVLCELVDQPGLLRVGPGTRSTVARFVSDLGAAIAASHDLGTPEVLYGHLRRSGLYRLLVARAERGDEAPLRRVAGLFERLRTAAALVVDPRPAVLVPHVRALLEAEEHLVREADGPPPDAVSVLTVHRAKGLEFPVVFLTGLVDGRFPARGRRHRLSLPDALRSSDRPDEPSDAEERRLCYVAMTRARDELILTHAATGAAGGRRLRPSPFIAEALDRLPAMPDTSPSELLEDIVAGTPPLTRAQGPGPDPDDAALSFSAVDDMLACPLRYHLRHRVRVPTPPSHALVVGSALHQAVAAAHAAQMRGRELDEAALQEVLRLHWRSEGFHSRQHEDARFAAGSAALRRFRSDVLSRADRRVLSVERPFAVRLGRDAFRGRMDLVTEGPDGVVITDYKSSEVRDQSSATKRARESLQLQLYALAWEAETGSLPDVLELHFLDGGRVGRVRPDQERLGRAMDRLTSAGDAVRAGARDAHPDRFTCGSCPYRDICPSSAA